ncbi:MAG: MBL fold metallo-hydrolase, partial [Candidatus Pacebacteria bacterium]|nr:MBL fold metallo-hydrolase [Candidatus Paceibacterota bacterium]
MEIKRLVVGELFTNCYLLYSKGELLVIDPGGEPERILEEIKKYKVFVKYIVNTHTHFDHILGNEKIKRE